MIIAISNKTCKILKASDEAFETIEESLTFDLPNKFWILKNRPTKWWGKHAGTKCFVHRGYRTFPTGLLPYVLQVLDAAGWKKVSLHDTRDLKPPSKLPKYAVWHQYLKSRGFQVDPLLSMYQIKAARAFLRRGLVGHSIPWYRGCLSMATGSGKTVTSFLLAKKLGGRALYLVNRQDLVLQGIDVYEQLYGLTPGIIGMSECDPQRVTFGMIQTLAKRIQEGDEQILDYLLSVRTLVVDEAHQLKDNQYYDIAQHMPNASNRVALSGSLFRRADLGNWYLQGVFGDVMYHLPSKTLREHGLLARVQVYLFEITEPKIRGPWNTAEKGSIVYNEYRNTLGMMVGLHAAAAGWPTLLLVRLEQHGKELQRLFRANAGLEVPFLCFRDKVQLRKAVADEMRNDQTKLLITTGIFKMGLDIPPIRCVIRLDAGKSKTDSLQIPGRAMRHKEVHNVMYLIDFYDRTSKPGFERTKTRVHVYQQEDYELHEVQHPDDIYFEPLNSISPESVHDTEGEV